MKLQAIILALAATTSNIYALALPQRPPVITTATPTSFNLSTANTTYTFPPQKTLRPAVVEFFSDTACSNDRFLGTKVLPLVNHVNMSISTNVSRFDNEIECHKWGLCPRWVVSEGTIESAQSALFDDTGDASGWAILQTDVPDGDGFNETNPLLQSCVTFEGLGSVAAEAWVF